MQFSYFQFYQPNSQIIDVLELLPLEKFSYLFTVNKVTVSIPYFFLSTNVQILNLFTKT